MAGFGEPAILPLVTLPSVQNLQFQNLRSLLEIMCSRVSQGAMYNLRLSTFTLFERFHVIYNKSPNKQMKNKDTGCVSEVL